MKRLSSRHMPRLVAEIHYAPWVDLLLVVLLAFLVLTTAWQAPAAKASPGPVERIELVVTPDLKLTLAGAAVEQQALITELARRVKECPEIGVVAVIPAGMSATNLLQIMEAMRTAGVRHTAVTATPPASTPPPP